MCNQLKIAGLACVAALLVALSSMLSVEAASGKKSAKSKPLHVTVHPSSKKRRGGYSYGESESYTAEEMRRLFDPPRQSRGGPFDSGFFFDSPIAPRGGDSPYMN
jgi:hypothetical protein